MTVQFDGDVIDERATLDGFWPRIRDRYPNLTTQPPLPPMKEDFSPGAPGVSIQLFGPGAGSRYWFASHDQAEVVQVQRDRFAFNWRKEPAPGLIVGEYPRYAYLRERFVELLAEFQQAAGLEDVTDRATWCEIAYINQIGAAAEGGHRPLASILRFVQSIPLPRLPAPQDSAFVQRHRLSRGDEPVGRFHINANAAFKVQTLEPIYVLNLTVRSMTPSAAEGGVMAFMDDGRDLAIQAFRDATTPEMHAEWGLE